MNPQQVYLTARELVNTPFKHQGRSKDLGVDCIGVPLYVCNELELGDFKKRTRLVGFPDKREMSARTGAQQAGVPPMSDPFKKTNYPRYPDGTMQRIVEELCSNVVLQPGALLLFKISTTAQHCGIVSEYQEGMGLIHAWDIAGKVCEHKLTLDWLDKIVGCYGLPSVDYLSLNR